MLFTSFLKWADRITIALCVVLLAAIAVLTVVQILARYVFFVPMVWSYEVVTYLFVVISALGAAVVLGERSHFSIPLLADALGGVARRVLNLVIIVACLAFSAIFIVKGFSLMGAMRILRTPILGISESIPYSILPIAGVYMGLHSLRHLLIELGLMKDTDPPKQPEHIEVLESLK